MDVEARCELRKHVWRAVRQLGAVLLLAPVPLEKLTGLKPGMAVLAEERDLYDDGRVLATSIHTQGDGKEILYLPLVEPEDLALTEVQP